MSELIRSPKLSDHIRFLPTNATPISHGDMDVSATEEFGTDLVRDKHPEEHHTPHDISTSGGITEGADADVDVEHWLAMELQEAASRVQAAEEKFRQLQESIDEVYAKAKKEGLEAGRKEGYAASHAENKEQAYRLKGFGDELLKQKNTSLVEAEDSAVEVVFSAVCKIVGDILITREGVSAVVNNVLQQVVQNGKLLVRLSQHDYDLLINNNVDWCTTCNTDQTEFVADSRVRMGGCIVESDSGSLDGRLETQLERLADFLLEARKQRRLEVEIT